MAYRNAPSRRDKWKTRVGKTQSVPPAARLFLLTVLAPKMNAEGHVSVPRKKLAAAAGVSERRVTRFITQAKEAGWLVVVQAGYRTMTAEYQASFPNPESGNNVFSHSEPERGNKTSPHCAGTECSPIHGGKREQSVPTTSSSTTRPLRVVRGTDRTFSANLTPRSLRCAFGFGLSTHRRNPTARTTCPTQPRTVDGHRAAAVMSPVAIPASGAVPATRSVCLNSRPRRKALATMETQPWKFCCPGTRVGGPR